VMSPIGRRGNCGNPFPQPDVQRCTRTKVPDAKSEEAATGAREPVVRDSVVKSS
jgi:hypothetical protein